MHSIQNLVDIRNVHLLQGSSKEEELYNTSLFVSYPSAFDVKLSLIRSYEIIL